MNELDNLIAEYAPLSSPLPEEELQALKKRVLSKSLPKRKPYKLMIALAAAMCLLAACGAIASGFFDSMTTMNQTTALVEKYGQILENPPSVTVDGHTEELPGYESSVGYCQLRQSGPIGRVSETGSTRYFADFDLTDGADTVSLYVLSEDGTAEIMQIDLPEPAAEKQSVLPHVVYHLNADDQEIEYIFLQVTITPFRITLEGIHNDDSMNLWDNDPDWYSLIHLYNAEGKEIQIGREGTFYTAGGSLGPEDFSVTLGSYNLIDPEEIVEIEIDGNRYPLQ